MPSSGQVTYMYDVSLAPKGPSVEAAIRLLEQAPVRTPMDTAQLAALYYEKGQQTADAEALDRAETLAQDALKVWPTSPGAHLTLAQLANTRHDFRRAIQVATPLLVSKPTTSAYSVLVSARVALGELAQAAALAEAAVERRPSSASYLMRALVFEAQGRDEEAYFDFLHAVRAEEAGSPETSARLRTLWARFLLRRGELAAARPLIDEARRIAPGFALAIAMDAQLALRSGRALLAEQLFGEAFSLSRRTRYLIDEAKARSLRGDAPGANALRDQVEALVRPELGAGGLGHRLELAEVLSDRANAARCTEAVELARAEATARPSAAARFQLARALACAGRDREAAVEVQAVMTLGAPSAEAYELAAYLERRVGYGRRARLYEKLARGIGGAERSWARLGLVDRMTDAVAAK